MERIMTTPYGIICMLLWLGILYMLTDMLQDYIKKIKRRRKKNGKKRFRRLHSQQKMG